MIYLKLTVLVLLLAACSPLTRDATSETAPSTNVDPNVIDSPDNRIQDLSDYLRRIAGVSVQGSGANARVFIRGGASNISGGLQEPLFVINGTPVRGGYSQIYSFLPIQEIEEVRVLKDADTAIYGTQGGNGVIEITTK